MAIVSVRTEVVVAGVVDAVVAGHLCEFMSSFIAKTVHF